MFYVGAALAAELAWDITSSGRTGSIEQARTECLLHCTDATTGLRSLHARDLCSSGSAAEVKEPDEAIHSVQALEGASVGYEPCGGSGRHSNHDKSLLQNGV
jgi:hypothetical protein